MVVVLVFGMWYGLRCRLWGCWLGLWCVLISLSDCVITPGVLVAGLSGWVVVVLVGEAEAWLPARACEYSIAFCRGGARRGILVYVRNIAMKCRERQFSVEKVELIMVRQELQSLSTVCRAWTLGRGDINDILASQQVKSSSIAYHNPMSNVKISWRVLFLEFST